MSNYKDKFPAKYLKVEDLNGRPLVVTISRVDSEEVGPEKDDRDVVYFREITKGLIVNKTNGESIAELANSELTEEWPGTRLQLYPAKTKYQGKTVACVRIGPAPAASPKVATDAAAIPLSFADELGDDSEEGGLAS